MTWEIAAALVWCGACGAGMLRLIWLAERRNERVRKERWQGRQD